MTRAPFVAAVLLALVLTGCSGDATSHAAHRSATTPAAASTRTPAAAGKVPKELRGTWMTRLTRDQIRHDLVRYGFGDYADAFFASEKIGVESVAAVTLLADSFEVAYRNPDGSWQVGWGGPADEADGALTFHDTFSGIDDTYHWSVQEGRMALDWIATTGSTYRDIPEEAYSRGYFSRPYSPVDCTPADLEACYS
jgi:hypothetical protein